jgi:dipeptidyl aminopeptidase/acylaminoacyl peptidase
MPEKRRMSTLDLMRFTMADDAQLSPDGTRVAWVKTTISPEENRYRSQIVMTDVSSGETIPLTAQDGAAFPRWSPDGNTLAFLAPVPQAAQLPMEAAPFYGKGLQLHLIPASGGEARVVTALKGGVQTPRWSPDGTKIAFTTYVDPERGLEALDAPLQDDPYHRYNRDVLVVKRVRWKSDALGLMGNVYRQVAVVDVNGDATPRLVSPVGYDASAPAWSPDGSRLAVAGNFHPDSEFSRQQTIYLLHPDRDDRQAEGVIGLQEMRSSDLAWSPDGTRLAVCGHDDPVMGHYGFQKLWIVDVAERRKTCVSEAFDLSFGDYSRNADMRRYGGDDGPRWLPDGKGLLLLVNEGGAVNLGRFDLDNRTLTPVTEGDHAVIAFTIDDHGQRAAMILSDSLNPGDVYTAALDTSPSDPVRLSRVNGALLDAMELSEPIRFKAHSSGVAVDGWVMPPVGLEPGKRYPVILYTGGGPGGMRASVFCHEFQLYAAQGYVVINCNARGNYGYGQDFSLATRGKWGDLDGEDNMAYLNDACEAFDFIDAERVAVAGGSYGGYMATWLVSRDARFKAAVVDRTLANRYVFNGTSDIGFLLDQVEFGSATPWSNPEVYLERSPLQYVAGIRTPTLVVHSALDFRCPIEQGEQLYMALKRLGVPTALIRFPDETHELSRSGRPWHRAFRLERYLEWFGRYL